MSTKTWTADCFMGSDVGWQEVTVQSNTVHGARKMIEQIYEPEFIQNLHEESDDEVGSAITSGCFGILFLPLMIGLIVSLMGGPILYAVIAGIVVFFMMN